MAYSQYNHEYKKRLGGNPIITACVGNDGLGKFLINHLKNNNIDTNLINSVNHSTSMVLVTKIKTHYQFSACSADYNLEYNSDIDSTLKNSKIVHFSDGPISLNLQIKKND